LRQKPEIQRGLYLRKSLFLRDLSGRSVGQVAATMIKARHVDPLDTFRSWLDLRVFFRYRS
jgi:hypothetical protein